MERKNPTSQVSIPNAYMSLSFVILVAGFPGFEGRISSGALPRWKPATSLSDHRSGREMMREEPKPVMRGVPSGPTKTFCYKYVRFLKFWKYEIGDDLTEQRRPWMMSRSCTCFNPQAIPRT